MMMKDSNERVPTPGELEKEIGEFLSKKFGNHVKLMPPVVLPRQEEADETTAASAASRSIDFDLKPQEMVAYLDRFIVKQDPAKSVLATKICTHFNRIRRFRDEGEEGSLNMVGSIKNNVLMIGPTGVGKTYMVKLIAKKIGVPFVKGDATKFSETGYVGGDVEDLVRDLVREADGDTELAQYGIIYIDEIDKIASSRNLVGADVSRTGVQRALLKPMEETEVDMKVPHDPISMLQEIERYRKTGKRDKSVLNTRHVLFIVSGAFQGLSDIVAKRMASRTIGFGASLPDTEQQGAWLRHVQAEDLIAYGFESEFVGRLPVRAIFETLTEADLLTILENPSNPVVLGKKLDFAAYGIDIKFEDRLLARFAEAAARENTGARGLVSAVEEALLPFEQQLPSLAVRTFAATETVVSQPKRLLAQIVAGEDCSMLDAAYERLADAEKERIARYVTDNWKGLCSRTALPFTPARAAAVAACYGRGVMELGTAVSRIQRYYEKIKDMELRFFKQYDINIVLEEGAVDYFLGQLAEGAASVDTVFEKMTGDFQYGLRLIMEKTGKNRFFLSAEAVLAPERYLNRLIKDELKQLS